MTHDDIMATASHYSEVDAQGYIRFAEDDLVNFSRALNAPAIDASPDNSQAVALSERVTQLQNGLETALEFIADATITEGQWHWVEEARAALSADKEPK